VVALAPEAYPITTPKSVPDEQLQTLLEKDLPDPGAVSRELFRRGASDAEIERTLAMIAAQEQARFQMAMRHF